MIRSRVDRISEVDNLWADRDDRTDVRAIIRANPDWSAQVIEMGKMGIKAADIPAVLRVCQRIDQTLRPYAWQIALPDSRFRLEVVEFVCAVVIMTDCRPAVTESVFRAARKLLDR